MQKILRQVLDVIRPSRQEMKGEIQFTKTLLAHIRANSPSGCDVVLTGSMAKRTFIREKRDVDVFVLFKRSVPRGHLEPAIKGILKKAFPGRAYQLSYAEHPYARFRLEGRRIDLVPAYRIADASERVSAVDRSVLHTSYVLRNLKSVDDVLLLKSFLQANSLYGAEIKIRGFSGYLCELLIIRHGSFPRLLKAASKWKPPGHPVFIDIKKYHKGRKAIREAALRFGNLTVIDPTDRNRNVAAAVSAANLACFTRLCREFLKKPSAQAFLRKPESFEERLANVLKAAKGAKPFMVTLPRPDVVDDVLWGQLHRMIGQLEHHLAGFKPKTILADDSQHIIRLAVLLKKDSLPKEMVVEGPPLGMKAHVKGFRASHRGARFIARKKKLCAIVKRPITSAEGAIMDFFRKLGKTKSHLACGEELVVLEPIRRGKKPPAS
jgi:tRNA nucleotidyltransferase (CCA-adding enzyme)